MGLAYANFQRGRRNQRCFCIIEKKEEQGMSLWLRSVKDARRAIRELNGIVIRDNRMLISFAKYDRNGKRWSIEEDNGPKLSLRSEEIQWKNANGERTFKEVLLNLPTHQKREAWVRKSNIKMQDSESNRTNKQLDEVRLKKMALKVVEEVFQSENLAEVKCMLVVVIVEVMNKLQREGTILNEALIYVKEAVEPRMNRQE